MSDSLANDDPPEQSPIPPELIGFIPEDQREEIISRIVLQEQYAGPLAHPSIVEGYERYLPGSADRILTMAEVQQRHRFQQEDRAQVAARKTRGIA